MVSYTPAPGYETDFIDVCNANNDLQIIPTYGISESQCVFVMPNFDVKIKSHFSPLSIWESNSIVASVYPNPTSGQVTIEAEGLKHVSICNMLGQIVYDGKASGNEFIFDFGGHKPGLYLIRIETSSGVAVKKVSVAR